MWKFIHTRFSATRHIAGYYRWGNLYHISPLIFPVSNLKAIQDFLYKLGMKLHINLVEIIFFLQYGGLVRPTKIINHLPKKRKFWFQCWKSVESFDFFPLSNMSLGDQFIFLRFLEDLIFKILYFLKMCPIFGGSLDDFGRSENDMV